LERQRRWGADEGAAAEHLLYRGGEKARSEVMDIFSFGGGTNLFEKLSRDYTRRK